MKASSKLSLLACFVMVVNPLGIFFPAKVAAAAPPNPPPVITVLAAGARASVLEPTTDNDTSDDNGTAWYYNVDRSMGFAPSGSSVSLNSADVSNTDDPLRLSWHTNGTGGIMWGWRAGIYNGWNTDDESLWTRYIYESDTQPAYYPFGPQANVDFASLTGWTLCYSGDYSQSESFTNLWSACTGNYLLFAGQVPAHNRIDVTLSSSSILNSPGGSQASGVSLHTGDTLGVALYQADGSTPVSWSHFRVYVSNCAVSGCSAPGDPATNPGSWDGGTAVAISYLIPSAADTKYLAVLTADDVTDEGVPGNYVILHVEHTPAVVSVSSCQNLQDIKDENLTDTYNLTTDLDCTETASWNGGDGFEPIGTVSSRFMGTFNGQGHTISNLTINRSGWQYVGLFGVIDSGGVITDLNLSNVNINGNQYVGALAGALAGTVTNVSSSGSVTGHYYVGGLVGEHLDSSGIGSSSPLIYTWNGTKYTYIADVGRSLPRNTSGDDYTPVDPGKLVTKDGKYSLNVAQEYNEIAYYDELSMLTFDHAPGYRVLTSIDRNQSGNFFTVSNTASNPLVSCTDKYGNDCASALQTSDNNWSYKDSSNINYWTLNFGNLSGASRIQLIMQGARDYSVNADNTRFIQVKDAHGNWVDAYTASRFSAPSGAPLTKVIDLTGKFPTSDYSVRVGFNGVRMNYFAIDTSTQQPFTMHSQRADSASLGFHGFTAIDKTNFWDHDWNNVSTTPAELFAQQSGNFTKYGDVTPLIQGTDDHFVVMHYGDDMTVNFKYTAPAAGQVQDTVLYSWVTYKHASTDTGKTVDPLPFQGMSKYPGKYPLTLDNIDYLKTWNTRVIEGPSATGSTIINSYSNANVTGYQYLGGLVGYNDKHIEGSYATGQVNATGNNWSYAGGLVGENYSNGDITTSYATGTVSIGTGDSYNALGGFVGFNWGSITTSYETGGVTGDHNIAGFVGENYGTIDNSFARGPVSGNNSVGGFSGFEAGTLTNVYTTSAVSTFDITPIVASVGALVGVESGTLINSFYDSSVSVLPACGNVDCSANAFGKTTAEMKTQATFTTDLGSGSWDFSTIWMLRPTLNDGYPFFKVYDSDTDGIPTPVENAAPNGGDVNNDTVPDSQQAFVSSFVDDVTGKYAALVAPDTCAIGNVYINPESSLTVQDSGYNYPAGLLHFSMDCGTPGYTATVDLYFFGVDPAHLVLRKFNSNTNGYSTLTATQIQSVTVGGQQATKVTYQVTDGGPYDMDGAANGVITDPVGLGFNTVGVPNTGLGGGQ